MVLRDLDLRLNVGEQVAVIGASGAGKTSLLQALACAVAPRAGSVRLFGQEPWALASGARQRLRGRLFLAPQVPPLPPRQRVVTAVLAGRLPQQSVWQSLRTLWSPREPDAATAQAALAALDLPEQLWQRVDRLSGGERQRVGLARLLVSDAELWLVDEPLSALDPARVERVIQCLTETALARQRTLVCSLHQVEVARRCFARILALRDGQLVFDGPAHELTNERIRALYGADLAELQRPDAADPAAVAAPAAPQAMCR
ncbi:MAG: phosphonate ABC transporter ATP-binding protein [Leptothrix sp. (in: b-proteobacteria)]